MFMQRYAEAERMAPYLMDAMLPKIRAGAWCGGVVQPALCGEQVITKTAVVSSLLAAAVGAGAAVSANYRRA